MKLDKNRNRNTSEKSLAIGLFIVTIAGLGLSGGIVNNNDNNQAEAQQVNNITRVEAGGGNSTAPLIAFIPQSIEIQAGQTINWYNPTPVEEPHSVAILKNSSLIPLFAAPYAIPASTEFRALMPIPNTEPLIVPSNDTETQTVVVANARSFNPTVLDATGQNVTYLPPNAKYTMDGSESYINSGWIWPEGQVPLGAPPITEFSVTFERPGIYDYVCTIHPWMTGRVVVS
jgi:plastocyanin